MNAKEFLNKKFVNLEKSKLFCWQSNIEFSFELLLEEYAEIKINELQTKSEPENKYNSITHLVEPIEKKHTIVCNKIFPNFR